MCVHICGGHGCMCSWMNKVTYKIEMILILAFLKEISAFMFVVNNYLALIDLN